MVHKRTIALFFCLGLCIGIAGASGFGYSNPNLPHLSKDLFIGSSSDMRGNFDFESIVLENITEPVCNSDTEGMLLYNATSKVHRGCNSTEWNDLY